jgi:hypothetical protein
MKNISQKVGFWREVRIPTEYEPGALSTSLRQTQISFQTEYSGYANMIY